MNARITQVIFKKVAPEVYSTTQHIPTDIKTLYDLALLGSKLCGKSFTFQYLISPLSSATEHHLQYYTLTAERRCPNKANILVAMIYLLNPKGTVSREQYIQDIVRKCEMLERIGYINLLYGLSSWQNECAIPFVHYNPGSQELLCLNKMIDIAKAKNPEHRHFKVTPEELEQKHDFKFKE